MSSGTLAPLSLGVPIVRRPGPGPDVAVSITIYQSWTTLTFFCQRVEDWKDQNRNKVCTRKGLAQSGHGDAFWD